MNLVQELGCLTKTIVKKHKRKGTKGVKRHSRILNTKEFIPSRRDNNLTVEVLQRKVFKVKKKIQISQFEVLNPEDVYYATFKRGNTVDVQPMGELKGSGFDFDSMIRGYRRDITIPQEILESHSDSFIIYGKPKEIKSDLDALSSSINLKGMDITNIVDLVDDKLLKQRKFEFWNRDSLINEISDLKYK